MGVWVCGCVCGARDGGWPIHNSAGCASFACECARMDFSFSRYRIVPLGSNSKIAQVGNERVLSFDLYNGRGFFRRSFNIAMSCFLECIGELGAFAEGKANLR